MMQKLFGRIYEGIGSIEGDLILKTRGEVKIQVGKKFIDLIKNGKIVGNDSNYLSKVESIDDISSNGIYICNDIVYIKSDDLLIQIGGNESLTYVSYISLQESIESEQRTTARKNIGLEFDTINDALNQIDKGLVFVNNKIYYISNGTYTEYLGGGLENPYRSQIHILKDNYDNGALVLSGDDIENGLFINNSKLYELNGTLYIDANNVIVSASGNEILNIDSTKVKVNGTLEANRLSINDTLEVDKIVQKSGLLYFTIGTIIDTTELYFNDYIESGYIYVKCIDKNDLPIKVFPDPHFLRQNYTFTFDNPYNYLGLFRLNDVYEMERVEFNVYGYIKEELKEIGVYYYNSDTQDYVPLQFYIRNTYGDIYNEPIINNIEPDEPEPEPEEESEEEGENNG